jgi:hypothetical protein
MTKQEILQLIKKYIGVSEGYLCDFTKRSHEEFYAEFCNLDIDATPLTGTTREKFQHILTNSPPDVQAKIIRGVLAKCPPVEGHELRTQEGHDNFLRIAQRLEGIAGVGVPTLATTSAVVERALSDAETLIKTNGATSGVDRIHTAIHGYMRAVCDSQSIPYSQEATISVLFNWIRASHSAFIAAGPRADDITKILRAMSTVMDVLNPIRNNASVAHPNENLLEEAEAKLVINAARTILHYIDAKLTG